MRIDGRCHCGRVAFEAEIDPDDVSICHCTDCQTLTGSPFRVTVKAPRDAVRLTRAEPKTYVKASDSGRNRVQMFCADCGSPLFTTGEGADAEIYGIRWGSIRQRGELAPKRQIWCRSAVAWIGDVERLPARPGD